jgi:hypothetical protein
VNPEQLVARVGALFNKDNDFAFAAHVLCLTLAGSHSHGTYIPPTEPGAVDDIDLFGIMLPAPKYILGLDSFEHWGVKHEELDVTVYSLHKLVGLLLKGNPNVLGLLWLRPEHYLFKTPLFDKLIANRSLFATKAAYHSFAGYADGQLRRMTSYTPEIQAEIERLEAELLEAGWHLQDIMDRRSVAMPVGISPYEANEKAHRLRTLRAKYHSAYMGEKRRNLVVKHGYDTKNAAHLVRLLLMCIEFLGSGELQVYRTADADMLKDIKRGVWTLEHVKEHAEELFAQAKEAYASSPLPEHPDFPAVSTLLTSLYLEAYGAYG